MENISRKMGKNVAPKMPKPSKKSGNRTLLLVGRDGNVKQVGWLKGLFVFCLIMLAVSAGAAGLFYTLHQQALEEIQRLRHALMESENRARALTKEKNRYMDQMVTAETKSGNNRGPENGKTVTNDKMPDTAVPGAKPTPVEKQPEEPVDENEAEEGPTSEEGQATGNSEEMSNNESSTSTTVEADDLQVKRFKNTLKLEFNLKNVSPNSRPISGHAIAVLKTTGNSKNWLTMPEQVGLVAGKPDASQRGERFRISRFKTIDLATKYDKNPEIFKTATIFIFNGEDKLILEKDFEIAIE